MTHSMIAEVGKIHSEAFAGYMNTRLGPSYMNAFLTWFLQGEHRIALVAVDSISHKILGYVLGAPIDYGRAMNRELLGVAIVGILGRPRLLLHKSFWRIITNRLKSTVRSVAVAEPNLGEAVPAMSLIAIGVLPSARGQGIASLLLKTFEEKARQLGTKCLQLTVYPQNAIARGLYESKGWSAAASLSTSHVIEYRRML